MADSTDVNTHDFQSLLSSPDRDFLLRNNGDQVKIDSLKGKNLGFYFSASWCRPCLEFTITLEEVYNEVSQKGDFEVIFVTRDVDDESFKRYFSKMPWLAIPFSDSETRNRLDELFHAKTIPRLALIDETGKVVNEEGFEAVREYGVEGYPFTPERIQELKDQEDEVRRNQSLRSLLGSDSRDFVISADGKKIPICELEGKTVGLYFCAPLFEHCNEFSQKLKEVYEKLKEKGKNFEVVFIPTYYNEESLEKERESMPWLYLPMEEKTGAELICYFEIPDIPITTLLIIGPDGKTLHPNVAEAIEDYGIDAYPFTSEKFAELENAQTLESILVSGDQDFIIGKDGVKISVSELKGKTVLLYFSAQWCPPCCAFLPKLIDAYHKIKEKDTALEVVFISSDVDQASFDDFFSEMPWLALPFGDSRKTFVSRRFKVYSIPTLVAINSSGRTITKEAKDLVSFYGADAYPFTDERIREIEAYNDDIAKGWPGKLVHETHDHELVLTRREKIYYCDDCNEMGHMWSYYCDECGLDHHPKCAFEDKGSKVGAKKEEWWPEKVTKETHDHELSLMRRKSYACDDCNEDIHIWSYCCKECHFDLHPKCALEGKGSKVDAKVEDKSNDGRVCDGEVCSNA